MTQPPAHLGWEPWALIATLVPETAHRTCSLRGCGEHPVAGMRRRVRRHGGYQTYWQPYCLDHARRLGVSVAGGRLTFVAGFRLPLP